MSMLTGDSKRVVTWIIMPRKKVLLRIAEQQLWWSKPLQLVSSWIYRLFFLFFFSFPWSLIVKFLLSCLEIVTSISWARVSNSLRVRGLLVGCKWPHCMPGCTSLQHILQRACLVNCFAYISESFWRTSMLR